MAMNIILKSFDGEYCKEIIESAFDDRELGTCISIMNDKTQWPDLRTKEHLWIPAAKQRAGTYTDTDWNTITPLDEELIEAMRDTQAVFMDMVERYETHGPLSYGERKQQYLRHLRFWSHMLDQHKIDLLLLNHVPHQCYDYVLYDLCKLKGIQTLSLERAVVMDAFFVLRDWRDSGKEIAQRSEELKREGMPALSERFERYFTAFSTQKESPWFMKKERPRMQQSFLRRWLPVVINLLLRKPVTVLRALISPSIWARKLEQHRIHVLYETHAQKPDLSKPFIYVPLHMQPEATTCPMGGIFTHQELMVHMLQQALPAGIRMYIKEHPFQSERNRSTAFYEAMLDNPAVTFVPKTFDTFALTERCAAVATVTGTAGWEALFLGKPVFMFGSRFFQSAPGVHRIHTLEDCETAMGKVFTQQEKPDLEALRTFFAAMEECSERYVGGPDDSMSKEEKARRMGIFIAKYIASACA